MTSVLNFIAEHYGALVAAAGAIGVVVIAIVKATPTKKDDEILENIQEARKYLRNHRDE